MDDGGVFTVTRADGQPRFGRIWEADHSRAVMSLVHGFGEHSGRYADMARHLNRQGISVVAIDLTGHGRNPGKRGVTRGFSDFQDDLAALLEKTRTHFPDVPHILYGHSMGGGIVLDHGLSPDPDIRAIIASAPLIKPADPVPGFLQAVVRGVSKIFPSGAVGQALDGDKISTLPAEQKLYEQDPLNHGKLGFKTAIGIIENGETVAAKADVWKTPLLLLHAKGDRLTKFEASETFATKARHVTFLPMDNCAHEMHNDITRPQIYAAMIDFIKDWTG